LNTYGVGVKLKGSEKQKMPEPTTPAEPLAPASPAGDPSQGNDDQGADAAALREQLKKIELERNLLRNQKDKLERERLEREKRELEEKEDYRALAERANAEAEALRKEKQDAESKLAVEQATSEVFKEFDPKVIEIAKTVGLSASASTDDAKAELKTKLEAIRTQVGAGKPRVQGSNPSPTSEPAFDPIRAGKMMRVDDRSLREPAIKEAIGRHPQVAAFREYGKQSNAVTPQPL
jgi:hypothetical protein